MATVEIRGDIRRLLVRASEEQLEAIRERTEVELKREAPVDSGELRDSTYATLDRERGVISAGATAEHAPFIEYGHMTRGGTFVPPNPFIRRAVSRATRGAR